MRNPESPAFRPSLTCCGSLFQTNTTRRSLLKLAGGALVLSGLAPLSTSTRAASGDYEAMVLGCIDPRVQKLMSAYSEKIGLSGKYSAFKFAGASIGVVAPAFKDWQKTFWDNLAASVTLHNIKKLVVINHRDCGAAQIAFGAQSVANRSIETETHKHALLTFRQQLKERQPKLGVELHLMALDGSVDTFS
jgi:carbonic anhydrase